MLDNTPLPIFIASGLLVLFTLLYMAAHAAGLYRLVTMEGDAKASKLAAAAWIVSAAGGLMGPCVIVMNIAAIIMGIVALRGEPNAKTKLCAQTAVVSGGIIVGMTLIVTVIVLAFY